MSVNGTLVEDELTFSPNLTLIWLINRTNKSSHRRCSIRKYVLRNFTKFTGKPLCQSLFFNKVAGLRAATLLKRGSGRGVFLLILRNFQEHLFYRIPLDDCFWTNTAFLGAFFYYSCWTIKSLVRSSRSRLFQCEQVFKNSNNKVVRKCLRNLPRLLFI